MSEKAFDHALADETDRMSRDLPRELVDRAMNEGRRRVSREVRLDRPGSWIRLLAYALDVDRLGDDDLVALLSVAYEIGHQDGESEREMYADYDPDD